MGAVGTRVAGAGVGTVSQALVKSGSRSKAFAVASLVCLGLVMAALMLWAFLPKPRGFGDEAWLQTVRWLAIGLALLAAGAGIVASQGNRSISSRIGLVGTVLGAVAVPAVFFITFAAGFAGGGVTTVWGKPTGNASCQDDALHARLVQLDGDRLGLYLENQLDDEGIELGWATISGSEGITLFSPVNQGKSLLGPQDSAEFLFEPDGTVIQEPDSFSIGYHQADDEWHGVSLHCVLASLPVRPSGQGGSAMMVQTLFAAETAEPRFGSKGLDGARQSPGGAGFELALKMDWRGGAGAPRAEIRGAYKP